MPSHYDILKLRNRSCLFVAASCLFLWDPRRNSISQSAGSYGDRVFVIFGVRRAFYRSISLFVLAPARAKRHDGRGVDQT